MRSCLEAQDLLNSIFVSNPSERITLDEILLHKWMTGSILTDSELRNDMLKQGSIMGEKFNHEGKVLLEKVTGRTRGREDAEDARNPKHGRHGFDHDRGCE